MRLSVISRVIIALLLLWALDSHPYGYFIFLRWVTCLVGIYSCLLSYRYEKKGWGLAFIITSLIFNPLIRFHLDRSTWNVVDVAASVLFISSLFYVKGKLIESSKGP